MVSVTPSATSQIPPSSNLKQTFAGIVRLVLIERGDEMVTVFQRLSAGTASSAERSMGCADAKSPSSLPYTLVINNFAVNARTHEKTAIAISLFNHIAILPL